MWRHRGHRARRLALMAGIGLIGLRQPDVVGAGQPGAPREGAARQLYVASTGDDSAPGTAGAPLRTIGRAALLAGPGSTVHVAAGSYRETITTRAPGRAGAPVIYRSTTKWGAQITGSSTGAMWTNHGNFVQIIGFDISGPGRIGILNWASHVLVSGNRVHDLAVTGGCTVDGGAGIESAGYKSTDNDIIGNVVHDIGVPGACNRVHGIYASNLRTRILDNVVYRASAWGIHLWHAANRAQIARNQVYANGSSSSGGGILIGTGDAPGGVVLDYSLVVNNIVTDNPGGAIEQYCDAGQQCIGKHNVIADNIVRGNGRAVSLLVESFTSSR